MKNLSTSSSVKLFNVPISITSKSQALALVGEWLREWHGRKSQLKSAKSAKIGLQKKSDRSDSDSADLSAIRSGPPPAGQADPADTPTFPKLILTPNPEIIVAAQSDPALMKALQSTDLSIPDGIGIVWALKLLQKSQLKSADISKHQIADKSEKVESGLSDPSAIRLSADFSRFKLAFSGLERLSGLDLMEGMILKGVSFKDHPLKVMLLGGRPGVAQAAADILQKRKERRVEKLEWIEKEKVNSFFSNSYLFPFQHLNLNPLSIRALSGPQNISAISKSENGRLIAQINSFSPDLLFVAFGHPKQEKWLIANRESLTVGVAMAVGGAFDQIADPSLRPPPYINSIWLGWLYRLIREPWRWRRQLALLKFIGMVVKEKLKSSNSKIQMPNQVQNPNDKDF